MYIYRFILYIYQEIHNPWITRKDKHLEKHLKKDTPSFGKTTCMWQAINPNDQYQETRDFETAFLLTLHDQQIIHGNPSYPPKATPQEIAGLIKGY